MKRLLPTKFKGLKYYVDDLKGKVYVADVTINRRRFRQIIGYTKDEYRTNENTAAIKKEALVIELKKGKHNINIDNNSPTQKIYTYDLLFDEYIKFNQHSQSKSTLSTKEYYHQKHISKAIGYKLLEHISTGDVQEIINKMIDNKYKPQTTKHIKNIIKATLKYGIDIQSIKVNVADAVKIPKFDNKVEFTLSTEESKKLFDTILHFEEPMYRDIFIFLIHGRRKNEVLQMKWEYINLENRTYDVRASINKTRRNLRYPITDLLYDILYEREEKNGYVFINPETKKPFRDIRKAWDRIKAKAKISKPMRLHDLRHLIGNIIINDLAGSNSVAAAILGHSSTQMVDKRYSSVRVDTISKGINSVFEYLGK